ncbi:response regulator [Dongia deserti]|uniref:response regulator n=1 Tax=Dongia deserti TaxID=2268030 RepID=UPI000E65397F|nr:response regulator [Dongia deserti]
MPFAAEFVPCDTSLRAGADNNRRLLVVDQQHAFVDFARLAAQRLGYETEVVTDPRGLAERMRAWRPHVLVIEIVLPELDGFEIVQLLTEQGFDGELVLVTAHDPRYLDLARKSAEARGLRVAASLAKPVRAAEMIQALERCAPAASAMRSAI